MLGFSSESFVRFLYLPVKNFNGFNNGENLKNDILFNDSFFSFSTFIKKKFDSCVSSIVEIEYLLFKLIKL